MKDYQKFVFGMLIKFECVVKEKQKCASNCKGKEGTTEEKVRGKGFKNIWSELCWWVNC